MRALTPLRSKIRRRNDDVVHVSGRLVASSVFDAALCSRSISHNPHAGEYDPPACGGQLLIVRPHTMPKYINPAINETAFNCPHCGALTTQTWYKVLVGELGENHTPRIITKEDIDHFEKECRGKEMTDDLKGVKRWLGNMMGDDPFISRQDRAYSDATLYNSSIAICYNCSRVSFWAKSEAV